MQNNPKLLFITPKIELNGGGIFSNNIKNVILEIIGEEHFFELEVLSKNKMQKLFWTLSGYVMGLNFLYCKKILELIELHGIKIVFINNSCYGKLVKLIRFRYPSVKIICLFHNIEYLFVLGACRRIKRLQNYLTLCSTRYNEGLSIKYADELICLNKRDANALHQIYGKECNSIFPIFFKDELNLNCINESPNAQKIGLFVGSDFYANYYGLLWFAKNVSERISAKILVVGNGFEKRKKEFCQYKNLEIIGFVDNLSSYYYKADFVCFPIFDGSGMKTKTAESLMYGKTIIGTNEAFEGYDVDQSIGLNCNTADEFVEAINNFSADSRFNSHGRLLYEKLYSYDSAIKRMREILNRNK